MAFRSYSTMLHGIPDGDTKFNVTDTYVAVFPDLKRYEKDSQYERSFNKIKELFNILYVGPLAFNHYHYERQVPSQFIVVFEKKCPAPNPVQSALPTEVTPEATI